MKKIWRTTNTIASLWREDILGYLSLDIICLSKLIVFFELRSRKTVHFSEEIMSVNKYLSIFSRQMDLTWLPLQIKHRGHTWQDYPWPLVSLTWCHRRWFRKLTVGFQPIRKESEFNDCTITCNIGKKNGIKSTYCSPQSSCFFTLKVNGWFNCSNEFIFIL